MRVSPTISTAVFPASTMTACFPCFCVPTPSAHFPHMLPQLSIYKQYASRYYTDFRSKSPDDFRSKSPDSRARTYFLYSLNEFPK